MPLQKARMAFGEAAISRNDEVMELEPDCWTRVLSRSMGWRRTAPNIPEPRPAAKWKAVCGGRRAYGQLVERRDRRGREVVAG